MIGFLIIDKEPTMSNGFKCEGLLNQTKYFL